MSVQDVAIEGAAIANEAIAAVKSLNIYLVKCRDKYSENHAQAIHRQAEDYRRFFHF